MGLEICASGLYTLHDALQKNEWNESEIDARAEWLCEKARALWSYDMESVLSQEILEESIEENQEVLNETEQISVISVKDSSVNEKNQHQKMTDEMIRLCYAYGKEFHAGGNIAELVDKVECQTRMNRNSAIMYLYVVRDMLDGSVYKRAISMQATETYFDMIFDEYGSTGLEKAIKATRQHVEYRRSCGHMVDSVEQLCDRYQNKL